MADETSNEHHEHHEHHEHEKCHGHHHHQAGPTYLGPIWLIGWLFTIGYVHFPFFWKGVLALIIWPYYLGDKLWSLLPR